MGTETIDVDLCSIQESRNLARKGAVAAEKISAYSHDQIDRILQSMVEIIEENAFYLAELAVEETGFGKVEDKAYKNHMAAKLLYDEIKDQKTTGIISSNKELKTFSVAEPIGLILGVTPSTNPTSTIIYKSMIAIKARNAIVFGPHPAAKRCCYETAQLLCKAAVAAGAPEDIIGCVSQPSLAATNELMHAKEVGLIIATGSPGMVKSAYSVGKPAIGVGAGNSPAYIEKTADVHKAVADIVASKTFDNGTICASEQSVICEEGNMEEVVREFIAQGGYFMSEDETNKVCALLFKNGGHAMSAKYVGRAAAEIAHDAGISVPAGTKLLIGRQDGVGEGNPLSYEKLTTVLAFYVVKDWEEACHLSISLLQNGIGHTMSLHTNDPEMIFRFAMKPASRILINTGGTQGGTGLSTGLPIAFTLGCGTDGGSSVSENVGPKHLMNLKTVAYGLKDLSTLVQNDQVFQSLPRSSKAVTTVTPLAKDYFAASEKQTSCTTAADCKSISILEESPQEIQEKFENGAANQAQPITTTSSASEDIVRAVLGSLQNK
ncbi:acetaldehyde dehydrogenase (acetylating) [Lactovum odontotermitis]